MEVELDANIRGGKYKGKFGYLKPEYDWGLYNGSRGSNPYNPNPTGLYTYEGKELQGQWRTMKIEEILYLLGIPCLDDDYDVINNNGSYNFSARIGAVYNSNPPIYSDVFNNNSGQQGFQKGGYCFYPWGYREMPSVFPYYVNTAKQNDVTSEVYRYDHSAQDWAPYRFELYTSFHEVYYDEDTGNDVYNCTEYFIRPLLADTDHQVLDSDSGRYDSDGNPQYAAVTIIDQATMETISGVAILPDNDNWFDPCKNESSADGKIVKGLVGTNVNIYTKERWKFFMESSGAIFLSGFSQNDTPSLDYIFSYTQAFVFSDYLGSGVNTIYKIVGNSDFGYLMKGKYVPYVFVSGEYDSYSAAKQYRKSRVYLVQDAN